MFARASKCCSVEMDRFTFRERFSFFAKYNGSVKRTRQEVAVFFEDAELFRARLIIPLTAGSAALP